MHLNNAKALKIIKKFLICHRLPDRTFNIQGHYFRVCARHSNFYVYAFLIFIYLREVVK